MESFSVRVVCLRSRVLISGCRKCQCCSSLFFPLHPLNTSIFAAHGPFTWHDGAGLQPLKEKQKAAFISELHYLTPPSRVLHHPITAVFLSASPHPLLPRLPPLGKSEEVYGACAAEEHRKGFKVLG